MERSEHLQGLRLDLPESGTVEPQGHPLVILL